MKIHWNFEVLCTHARENGNAKRRRKFHALKKITIREKKLLKQKPVEETWWTKEKHQIVTMTLHVLSNEC